MNKVTHAIVPPSFFDRLANNCIVFVLLLFVVLRETYLLLDFLQYCISGILTEMTKPCVVIGVAGGSGAGKVRNLASFA